MRLRLSTPPLVAGFSAGAGATTALLLGAYLPGWGLVGGVSLALVTLAIGLLVIPGNRELVLVTLALASVVLGFLVATVPATLVGLEDFIADKLPELQSLARATVAETQRRLALQWAIAATAAIGASVVLYRGRAR
jgi:hypothetical protein